jgi:hypothetical protein
MLVAYIPDQVDGSDEEASIFWSLIVPAEEVPDTVANGTQREKLQFCCDKVQDWDPTLYVKKHFSDKQPAHLF